MKLKQVVIGETYVTRQGESVVVKGLTGDGSYGIKVTKDGVNGTMVLKAQDLMGSESDYRRQQAAEQVFSAQRRSQEAAIEAMNRSTLDDLNALAEELGVDELFLAAAPNTFGVKVLLEALLPRLDVEATTLRALVDELVHENPEG